MPKCPICQGGLENREVVGHYGGKFTILQCSDCSGILGKGEAIFGMSLKSAQGMDFEVSTRAIAPRAKKAAIGCPCCHRPLLEVQSQENLLTALHFRYCIECKSLWFDNKEQLLTFLAYLELKRRAFKKREAEIRRRKGNVKKGKATDIMNSRFPFSWDIFA